MRTRLLLAVMAAGLAMAATKTYSFDLFQPTMLGSTELAEFFVELTKRRFQRRAPEELGQCYGESALVDPPVTLNEHRTRGAVEKVHQLDERLMRNGTIDA